ncbi:uncharacterized protein LOC142356008 isoform X2 [Convolutriloba macropyga]|uniref:uncharacterized protein LOC142356008 isoform X2 n=1 Tax=Convolutriloba macropyga TaxID=536237 RepID=UPI003F525926
MLSFSSSSKDRVSPLKVSFKSSPSSNSDRVATSTLKCSSPFSSIKNGRQGGVVATARSILPSSSSPFAPKRAPKRCSHGLSSVRNSIDEDDPVNAQRNNGRRVGRGGRGGSLSSVKMKLGTVAMVFSNRGHWKAVIRQECTCTDTKHCRQVEINEDCKKAKELNSTIKQLSEELNLLTVKNDILMDMLCQHTAEVHRMAQENAQLKINNSINKNNNFQKQSKHNHTKSAHNKSVKNLTEGTCKHKEHDKLKPMTCGEPKHTKSTSSTNKQHFRDSKPLSTTSKNFDQFSLARSSAAGDINFANDNQGYNNNQRDMKNPLKEVHRGSHVDVFQQMTGICTCNKKGSSMSFGDVNRYSFS